MSKEDKPKVETLNRIGVDDRQNKIPGVLRYNILRKEGNKNIQQWKSYPSISNIVELARKVTEEGDTSTIGKLAEMMQAHESQQSAAVIAIIAVLVGSRLDESTDKVFREAIGDVITWNVSLINDDDSWPSRKKYMTRKMFTNNEDFS